MATGAKEEIGSNLKSNHIKQDNLSEFQKCSFEVQKSFWDISVPIPDSWDMMLKVEKLKVNFKKQNYIILDDFFLKFCKIHEK
jgi:hypothetical protein